MGEYWRVRVDDRDLNYDRYLTEGDRGASATSDYTSATTRQLSVDEIRNVLTELPEVRREQDDPAGKTGPFSREC
jgi:UDP-glucose 4-epimerase